MYKKGTIYHIARGGKHGITYLRPNRKTRLLYGMLRAIGAGFIGFAVVGILFTYGPVIKEEYLYKTGRKEDVRKSSRFVNYLDIAEADRIVRVQKEAQEYGVDSYFSLVIPKIGAKSNVIANIDPSNEEEYMAALKEGVAHARGTYFPGQGKNVYLFSHSTDSPANITQYNAVFYLLRKLEDNDEVIVYFADRKYKYVVEDVFVAEANDITWLTKEYDEEVLFLQTCDPPGTNWKRLIVVAKPVK